LERNYRARVVLKVRTNGTGVSENDRQKDLQQTQRTHDIRNHCSIRPASYCDIRFQSEPVAISLLDAWYSYGYRLIHLEFPSQAEGVSVLISNRILDR
jgi:hypothetical protein